MKKNILISSLLLLTGTLNAQLPNYDSLKKLFATVPDKETKFNLANSLVGVYLYRLPDTALIYIQEEILLAKEMNSDSALSIAVIHRGILAEMTGDFPQAIQYGFDALKIAERSGNVYPIATAYYYLSSFYEDAGDYKNALQYSLKAKTLFEKNFDIAHFKMAQPGTPFYYSPAFRYLGVLSNLSAIYDKLGARDSAFKYIRKVDTSYNRMFSMFDWPYLSYIYGNMYFNAGDYIKALHYYRKGFNLALKNSIYRDIMDIGNGLAKTFYRTNWPDSAIYYAQQVLAASHYAQHPLGKLSALSTLADVYKSQHKVDSAAKYFELLMGTKDSLFDQQKVMQMQSLSFNEQLRQLEMEAGKRALREQQKVYALIGGLILLSSIAFLLYRNNRQKQKAKAKIEKAYSELKATQTQLIQSEKMASLGELTAGIAHEIQNPLNFVNNFSEVNAELLTELKQELEQGNMEESKSLVHEIGENEQKINHHGKRADAIVKGMLQHSRKNTGQKELTDINALADEYLRLSYHGLRAKDKSFNAAFKTNFDNSIGKISIVPQDIGRVLLNLFNNAFYAVHEKAKKLDTGYEPTVSVSTKKLDDKIEINVKDNGMGISKSLVEKIFQPFFTTKPTGQGTGLGLSLSYDIIKAHGGELKVESNEGEGATFIIILPA